MKDAVATMGTILCDDTGGRDAVHVAVISATAGKRLRRGQHVGFVKERAPGGEHVASDTVETMLGIVDPFLEDDVRPNQRFWVYLYPRTITGLRHQWTHPAFQDDPGDTVYGTPGQKLEAEKWLRDYCMNNDCPSYETFMAEAVRIANGVNHAFDEEYMHFNDVDAHGDIDPYVWEMVSVVLGKQIKNPPKYFSCAC